MDVHAAQAPLIELPAELPHGLVFQHDFLAAAEESALLDLFAALPFREAKFKEYYARRRVVSFHSEDDDGRYDAGDDDHHMSRVQVSTKRPC